MKKIIFLLSCLLILQSCYTAYNSETPDGIDVYSSQFAWLFLHEKPIDFADKHCAKYDKIAIPVENKSWINKDVFKCEKQK